MNKYKFLLQNIGVLAVGQFGTKILGFLMVPLYTAVLSTEDYGNYDFISSLVSLLVPVLTLNFSEAILRFSIENKSERKDILALSLRYAVFSCLLLAGLLSLNHAMLVVPDIDQYAGWLFALYFANCANGMLLSYARGIERISDITVSGIIGSVAIAVLNIVVLLVLNLGLTGYFAANAIGVFSQALYLFIRLGVTKDIRVKVCSLTLHREMVRYSAPLIANTVVWWANSTIGRYIVIYFCGYAVNGLYSMANKIPSMLIMVSNIVSQAWLLSAVKEFDPDDKDGFFSVVYRLSSALTFASCSILIVLTVPLASLLYSGEFFSAWRYVPFLLIAVAYSVMCSQLGSIFSAVKDSKSLAITSAVSAVVNLALTLPLTYLFGAFGAGFASMAAYFIMWVLRFRGSRKYIASNFQGWRDASVGLLLVSQSFALVILEVNPFSCALEVGLLIIVVALYRSEFSMVMTGIKSHVLNSSR